MGPYGSESLSKSMKYKPINVLICFIKKPLSHCVQMCEVVTLKVRSHQAKVKAKAKKDQRTIERDQRKKSYMKEIFFFHVRFHSV